MSIFKKTLISFLCLLTILPYYSRAENPINNRLTDLLPLQKQFDALYFYVSYLKLHSKAFADIDTGAFRKKPIENMAQWREYLFTYIKNLALTEQSIFFCCIYNYINPNSNIMICAPPTAINEFKLILIHNIVNYDSTSTALIAYLTYSKIQTAKIMI